jgi:SanA protein
MKRKNVKVWLLIFAVTGILFVVIINILISSSSGKYIYTDINKIPVCYTVIVPGALVSSSGYPSDFLQDRLDVALELYKAHKITRFLLSGDHGHQNYDEVNNMKFYLLNRGVDTADIFLDHAGFDTYSTMVRAKKVFCVHRAIIVSQEFHLQRAIYIARHVGIEAYALKADKREYKSINRLKIREAIANIKAVGEILINKKPHFLGPEIPITGDSKLSYD